MKQNIKKTSVFAISILFLVIILLNGAKVMRTPKRTHKYYSAKGRPWYEQLFADRTLRIAVFWGWDHPRETIMDTFPAFDNLNGKTLYYKGQPVKIEIGMITQINKNPKQIFKQVMEDPTIDVVIYSGHARYGGGMAFATMSDIYRSGNGELIEDRHVKPFKIFKATSEDLDTTNFAKNYRIVMLNCCDSESHFRKSWSRRLKECRSPVDLVTVEFPVFNLYDNRRVLNFLQDLLVFSDWKSIKKHYDSEVHKRKNRLVVNSVFQPDEDNYAAK